MLLKFAEPPKTLFNTDTEEIVERFDLVMEGDKAIFKMGKTFLKFNLFTIELRRKENEIKHLYIIFPDVKKEDIYKISTFFNMSEEHLKELEKVETGTLVFSIEPETIEKYLQPKYLDPKKSMELVNVLDENNFTAFSD